MHNVTAQKPKASIPRGWRSLLVFLTIATIVIWILSKWGPSLSQLSPTGSGAGKATGTEGMSTMGSRVARRTIIAKPGEYSNRVSVPMGQSWNIEPAGRVMVLTATGKTWEDWPDRTGPVRNDPSPFDSMFQFKSMEEKEVEVVIEWMPK